MKKEYCYFMIKVALVSLGCSKNQVDSELILGQVSSNKGFQLVKDPYQADIIIVNTCGFIQDTKEESIQTILELAALKYKGSLKGLIATGCLTQRYQGLILEEMPEVDAILGTGTFGKINDVINGVLAGKRLKEIGGPAYPYKASEPRLLTDSHFAYVKIGEGCNNHCSYCSIPKIRGPYYSRTIDDIKKEVDWLTGVGVKEIILIAQDITSYGQDIYGRKNLPELIRKILENKDFQWLRLLYSYPESFPLELLDLMKEDKRICPYLDLPIQHSSNRIRKLMNRRGSRKDLLNLIKEIRTAIPDVVIRTSLIVGFPGEEEEDFEDLLDFIQEVKFDRLGVFKYSREEDTAAAKFDFQIPAEIKEERFQRIMEKQQKIAANNNQKYVNSNLEVIVDEIDKEYALGRTKYDAPEVDNLVYIMDGHNLKKGDIVKCRIKEAYEYDLIGELINE
jgi:ribosomal protein S12 methylthiotransferase